MSAPDRQQRLTALRDTIADIERKPALAEVRAKSFDARDGNFPRLPGGLLQEVFTDAVRNGGASLGFALGQAKTLLTPKRMAVLYLQLTSDGQFFGLPYGPGLLSFGFDPAQLVIVRVSDMRDFLWVAEESLACRAVAGIVADIGGDPEPLDFTASRRLSLRAAESGTSLFLLRYGAERQASAAHLRWCLTPHRSGRKRFDEQAPGAPRWSLELEKGVALGRQTQFLLEWTENGFATLPVEPGRKSRHRPTLPFAFPTRLADGLSQAARA
ncbi:ImuA family protein [Devosia sp. LjRoot3]|uniref:ImuA family protein n=1 Tax=Devosia sp. LjRoot3 TaxID=3342319 RepID=UPI003ECD40C8